MLMRITLAPSPVPPLFSCNLPNQKYVRVYTLEAYGTQDSGVVYIDMELYPCGFFSSSSCFEAVSSIHKTTWLILEIFSTKHVVFCHNFDIVCI